MRIAIVLPVLICCGPKVIEPASPHAACMTCERAIATNTPVRVASWWEGTCEDKRSGLYPIGPVEPEVTSCNKVKYTATLRCDSDACTSQRSDDGTGFTVRATRPGPLIMHVVMTTRDGTAHVIDLPRAEVFTPTAATVAACVIPAESPHPIVDLYLAAGETLLEDDPAMQVRVKGGEPCAGFELSYNAMNQDGPLAQRIPERRRVFRCPTAADHLELEIVAAGTTFTAETTCDRLPSE